MRSTLYYADADFAVADRAVALAKRHGAKPTQVALAWMRAKSAVTAPIVGASTLFRLDDTVGSLKATLSAEDIACVEEPYAPHPVLGFDPAPSR